MFEIKSNKSGSFTYFELAYWIAFLASIMLKCFYFQFTTQLNIRPFFSAENVYMLISSLGVLLAFAAVICILFNKKRVVALFVSDVILSIVLTADTNFYRYYYSIITAPVFLHIDVRLLSSVDQSIMSLFKIKDIIYILDLPVMLAGMILLNKRGISKVRFRRRAAVGTALLASGALAFAVGYLKADLGALSYNNNYIAKSLGVFYSHIHSNNEFIKEYFFENKTLSDKEKASIENFFKNKEKSGHEYEGIARGKNLIVVQVEALQQFVINRKIGGKEITPNLNKLIKESVYFDNFYFQVAGGNTSDAEFLCNTSLYPLKEGAVYLRYPDRNYRSLPKALKEQGYNTYALHAFDAEFWNRTEMYKAIGFDAFINGSCFVKDEFVGWEGNALSDASFFRQSLDKIDTSKPFYGFFITLSSHHPFNYFESFDFDTGEFEGSYLGNYLKAANYADKAIGQFIQDLKKRGLYENSLLVIYGDHSAVPKHMGGELMKFLGFPENELEWMKLQKVPCIIHYPGLMNGQTISTTGGEIDLFPTIANLMGIEAPYTMGKDLLNAKKGYVVLRSGSVITDSYIYLNNRGKIFDIATGKPLDKRSYDEELNSYLNELYISDLIIEKNAF